MKINEASSREQQQPAPLLGEIRLLQLHSSSSSVWVCEISKAMKFRATGGGPN
jgi:hypothetical protein